MAGYQDHKDTLEKKSNLFFLSILSKDDNGRIHWKWVTTFMRYLETAGEEEKLQISPDTSDFPYSLLYSAACKESAE